MDDIDVDATEVENRGTKRTADEAGLPPVQPKRIKALDQDVVNKIAAGEIIVAPMHALKELIENSVDAGSTSIEILVKDGGLKLLQITDNGHGINKDDLPILCERFTTSKLKAFEDLTSIGTYGFRGEALASISHIAHLTVTSKTAQASCAWRAHYADGRLTPSKPGQSAEPKATAGRGGTQITVEDLFYNIPTRRRAFRSTSEEYAKILDVVSRYAVHCSGVAFSCKKHGESGAGISVPANANTVDRIRQIHGTTIANEMLEFEVEDPVLGFKASGLASNANYHVKRTMLLLFINHRAVDSSAIRKAVDLTYQAILPKGGHPFLYLNLEVEPHRVDVNVHPTKREVNFLNEDEIIESVCAAIRSKLADTDTSRTFMTQTLLPGATNRNSSGSHNDVALPASLPRHGSSAGTSAKKPYENNLVRTDSKLRKITSMLAPALRSDSATSPSRLSTVSPSKIHYTTTDREPVPIRLTSVKSLRAAVRAEMHNTLTETIASHTYVGLVDFSRRIAAIQSGVKLYLVDYGMLSRSYFYQIGLTDFGNFGTLTLEPAPLLADLLALGAESEAANLTRSKDKEADFDFTPVIEKTAKTLIERRAMLSEYFGLEISEDGKVEALPLLLKGYMPSIAKLPSFLLRLGPYVVWDEEEACFQSFLQELSGWYAIETLPQPNGKAAHPQGVDREGDVEEEDEGPRLLDQRRAHVEEVLEHVLFPAMRSRLVATTDLLKGIVEVADLKGLYRVFERC